jgi:thiol-disulfide isomerase/thioredoxin
MLPSVPELLKNKYVLIALAVLLALLVLRVTREGFSHKSGKRAVVLYYLPGCGHCQRMMPTWEAFTDRQKDNKSLDVVKINCQDQPAEAEKAGVEGFPTVILYDEGGKPKIFDDERTVSALEGGRPLAKLYAK